MPNVFYLFNTKVKRTKFHAFNKNIQHMETKNGWRIERIFYATCKQDFKQIQKVWRAKCFSLRVLPQALYSLGPRI